MFIWKQQHISSIEDVRDTSKDAYFFLDIAEISK